MPDYPTTTRPRRAYDADGSSVYVVDGSTPSAVSAGDVTELNTNSEGGGVTVGSNDWLAIIFTERITIDAMFVANGGTSSDTLNVQTSNDSTNGVNGTWTAAGTTTARRGDTVDDGATWRANLITGLAYSCRGIRISAATTRWQNWIIHGSATTPTPGLTFLSSEYAAFAGGYHDWGVCARASSDDVDVYVKNTSTLDAAGVVVTVEAGEASDAFATQHYLSLDDRDFYASVYIGAVAAGARSGRVVVRRVTPSGATLGARAARLVASAAEWE